MTTRGITVLAGGLKETQEITRLAEAAGFDAAWSGEFLHRSGVVSALYSPSFTLPAERVAENTRAIIETFSR